MRNFIHMLLSRYSMVMILLLMVLSAKTQTITEVLYLERPHFQIVTSRAMYLYDRRGGGFSSIKDQNGIEWIGFQPGDGKVPKSADSDFRGLPNLVFRGEDNGAGHTGFNQCTSSIVAPNKIQTKSVSGKWEWDWTFYEEGAYLQMVKTDTSRAYWFLYEGIPGGSFDPGQKFWGNDVDGLRYDTPVLKADSIARGRWNWAYFGDQSLDKAFMVIHLTPDIEEDNFSYMGNTTDGILSPDGMVVFGFGRSGSTPLLKGENQFLIGFTDHGNDDPEAIQNQIKEILNMF
ncbi:MAG: hypothetical protein KI791_14350 [Cyclobacteriaceae bacterium]|nr:hypothetical protein [Cyclobacteriaceae bacterium SS2]